MISVRTKALMWSAANPGVVAIAFAIANRRNSYVVAGLGSEQTVFIFDHFHITAVAVALTAWVGLIVSALISLRNDQTKSDGQ